MANLWPNRCYIYQCIFVILTERTQHTSHIFFTNVLQKMSDYYGSREWMYKRLESERNCVSHEFVQGLEFFFNFVRQQDSYIQRGTLLCPCTKCKNHKRFDMDTVASHLYMKGFTKNYFVWTSHGERCYEGGEASTSTRAAVQSENWGEQYPYNNSSYFQEENYGDTTENFGEGNTSTAEPIPEEPYNDAKMFFEMLRNANQPLYEGCADGISELYLSSRVMNIKTKYNLPELCVDELLQTIKEILPPGNKAPKSYYETKKLLRSLRLPVQKIDVCEDNCMLFWRGEDKELEKCRFCKKDRYKPRVGGGKRIPKQRMFYLPITDRLKRLYISEATSKHMRWHSEHRSPEGEMHHPSDGAAWKHFQKVHPQFASESRNVYLGLSTDGFNPIGMNGQSHSVWPVIVTPYNLPPGMCMKREFFFLSVLVPGPKHPKKSLDIYLQPLIEELKELWIKGADAYDVSLKQNFKMRAALMWTISDFPAYGMLSGWTTHGRLSCPYCLEETKAFWLPNGRKHSWFDCHRQFLPPNHPYRRNIKAFTKRKTIFDEAPHWLNGEEILYERINNIEGLCKTIDCGGNGHNNPSRSITGYGEYHNWVKKSIFWDLPYWEDLLLRHNLDFMHIEKNFFDNVMNTVLNIPGKTKDNVKSRMDLATICKRPELELQRGKAPVPIFRLSKEGKKEFLRWMKNDIKFPDGYSSTFSRCVEEDTQRFSGLKSHDCHVIMQRLLPVAFQELLPKNVHTAISGNKYLYIY